MMIPTIHVNGSSKESLLEGVVTAGNRLREAMEALAAAAPNGRDYYHQGATAFTRAALEFEDRMGRLHSVYTELKALAGAIDGAEEGGQRQ